ncbi:MBL fold metallo-hydrolase [Algiphilus sp. NNCM1]|uniref:MBL fold metallo-hydrolase n=1 Tax=Algiphilus sp. TaxID=1872431 RepID=UPI001CA613C5|nr:MBL fold metallo-hydrolase [Algiphilus sp.]MBY8966060.1 MBL fold metallo-hydrolase [Algiphilus acroporae]MCI5062034.1 MBL fold metallo-hydrolase [Algiphilus sp.]MCI5104858.1 MBL fold metallo-hydrolase [Algiphilus sp.]
MTAKIHDAAAAVLLHEGQVLLVQRHAHLSAFPGYWAFPGGKVDAADRIDGEDLALARQRAMAREVHEEIGVDLPTMLADHLVADMAEIGAATTPSVATHRFATHFFRVDLRIRPELVLEPGEIADAQWRTPEEWVTAWREGRLLCAPPTVAILQALTADPTAQSAPDLTRDFEPADRIAYVEPVGGLRILPVRSHTIPPAQHTNCVYIVGSGLLIDPSPASDAELQRLETAIADWPLDAIFLTHHHPDHCERANMLARAHDVPLRCSADTRARITAREGKQWFDGVTVECVADGDRIATWQGEAVHAIAVPGHDAGQLAPTAASRAWSLVSDLIQGVGTVVVGGDEGDMAQYFASLERIIALDPMVIVPSHGMAMGGTWKLQATLAHREMREQQVARLFDAGESVERIVEHIYGDSTPPFLIPLARVNVESHLHKLRQEGRIAA